MEYVFLSDVVETQDFVSLQVGQIKSAYYDTADHDRPHDVVAHFSCRSLRCYFHQGQYKTQDDENKNDCRPMGCPVMSQRCRHRFFQRRIGLFQNQQYSVEETRNNDGQTETCDILIDEFILHDFYLPDRVVDRLTTKPLLIIAPAPSMARPSKTMKPEMTSASFRLSFAVRGILLCTTTGK